MGGHAWLVVFCLFVAGCSCGAIVIDSSGGTGGHGGHAGAPQTKPSGSGGVSSSVDSGPAVSEPEPADAGEDLIGPRSGSVIDVKGVSADGHPAIVQSVRDRVHGVDCSAQLANDGAIRCLPNITSKILYADPDCKNPVAVNDGNSGNSCSSENARYAVQKYEAICPSRGVALYSVGDRVATPSTLYSSTVFGCDVEPNIAPSNSYFAASPSPAAEWVAFKHAVKPVTSRLGVGYWTGTDGSRLIDSAWLLEQDAPCRDEVDESGNERCVPSRRAHDDSSFFTDNTCTTNVAVTFLCDPPDLLETNATNDPGQVPAQCLQPTIYAKLYTAVHIDSRVVYSTMGGACATTKYGGFVYYGPGTEVRFDAFPPIERTHGGGGRIQRMFWASEGKRLYADGLYDVTLNSPCDPVATPTISVCQVSGGYAGQYFADPKCTVSLYAHDPSDCTDPKTVLETNGAYDGCAINQAFPARRILQKHVGKVYMNSPIGFPGGNGSCDPSDAPADTVFYDLGDPIAPAQVFAPLTESDF